MIRAGMLRHKIEIWTKATEKNNYGEVVETWSKQSERRSTVKFLSGTEENQNSEIFYAQRISVTLRRNGSTTEQNQIRYQGQPYTIDSIETSFDGRSQVLRCSLLND